MSTGSSLIKAGEHENDLNAVAYSVIDHFKRRLACRTGSSTDRSTAGNGAGDVETP